MILKLLGRSAVRAPEMRLLEGCTWLRQGVNILRMKEIHNFIRHSGGMDLGEFLQTSQHCPLESGEEHRRGSARTSMPAWEQGK